MEKQSITDIPIKVSSKICPGDGKKFTKREKLSPIPNLKGQSCECRAKDKKNNQTTRQTPTHCRLVLQDWK